MRLLIITQTVDLDDPVLGFFHEWLARFAEGCDHLTVICLQKGRHTLDPQKVTVLSLGKEGRRSAFRWLARLRYALRFLSMIWRCRDSYESVFVHMNPEYIVLGGLWWRLWKKKIVLWYTHKSVTLWLRIAERLADRIATASRESFRLPSTKVTIAGHGIPADFFSSQGKRPPTNWLGLLSVGRISPSKGHDVVLQAVDILRKKSDMPPMRVSIIGKVLNPADQAYLENAQRIAQTFLLDKVAAHAVAIEIAVSVFYAEMPGIYHNSHILVHASETGSLDKVVLEALAAGRIVATSSEAIADLAQGELADVVYRFHPRDPADLARTIEKIWRSGILQTIPNSKGEHYVRAHHDLDGLISRLVTLCQPSV